MDDHRGFDLGNFRICLLVCVLAEASATRSGSVAGPGSRRTREPLGLNSDPSTVLVTGGAGLIGRAAVRQLVAAGRSVRVFSRMEHNASHPQIAFYRGDLTRPEQVRSALQGCSAVFHCAGEKSDPARMAMVNVGATRDLFALAQDCGVRFFCHLSSAGVTGRTDLQVVDETARCTPMNRYEETKLAAEAIVGRGLNHGTVVVLRPTNVFDADTLRPWLQKSLRSAFRLFITGNENSHLVYVEDVAAAALYCMQTAFVERVRTFIVSSDEQPGNKNREVHAALAGAGRAAFGSAPPCAPLWVPYRARVLRKGWANCGNLVYSSRKLREAGFIFPFGLLNGLNHALGELHELKR